MNIYFTSYNSGWLNQKNKTGPWLLNDKITTNQWGAFLVGPSGQYAVELPVDYLPRIHEIVSAAEMDKNITIKLKYQLEKDNWFPNNTI